MSLEARLVVMTSLINQKILEKSKCWSSLIILAGCTDFKPELERDNKGNRHHSLTLTTLKEIFFIHICCQLLLQLSEKTKWARLLFYQANPLLGSTFAIHNWFIHNRSILAMIAIHNWSIPYITCPWQPYIIGHRSYCLQNTYKRTTIQTVVMP